MNSDYIPQSYPNLKAWLEKQQTELTATLATNIDMTAQERTDYLAAVASYLAPVAQIVALMEQLEQLTPAPACHRGSADAEAQRGGVRITDKKPGFEAVDIYFRKKGDVQWKLIAVRNRRFLPYYDGAPLAVPGTPEVREYMAIGVIADEEIGQTSEIREVVYAG